MDTPDLEPNQLRVLESLVELVDDDTPLVSGEAIAAAVGRTPGTIRNRMQSLRALELVEGIPGPKGGYKPTAAAYRTLDDERLDEPADVPIECDGRTVRDANVAAIDLDAVREPDDCRAAVTIRGSVAPFSPGDRVTIGPTPSTGLRLSGTVDSIAPAANTITLDVRRIRTPTEPLAAD